MGWNDILKLIIWLITHGTTRHWQRELVAQNGNRSRGRAHLKSFVGPFMKWKVLRPFKVCFSQNCCLPTGVRRFVTGLTWTSNWGHGYLFICLFQSMFLCLQKVVVKDFRNLISTQLGGKLNTVGQRIFTCLSKNLLLDHFNLAIFVSISIL